MAGNKKISNRNQLEKLVQITKENSDIAKGIYKKSKIQSYWEKYANELNSLGPPSRSAENWLKVWTDLQFNAKKKLIRNKKEFKATGGGPNNLQLFTPLEEDIIDFLNLDSTVNPPGKEFGLNSNYEMQKLAEKERS